MTKLACICKEAWDKEAKGRVYFIQRFLDASPYDVDQPSFETVEHMLEGVPEASEHRFFNAGHSVGEALIHKLKMLLGKLRR